MNYNIITTFVKQYMNNYFLPVKNPHKWSAKDGTDGSKVLDTTSRSKISADNGSNTSTE